MKKQTRSGFSAIIFIIIIALIGGGAYYAGVSRSMNKVKTTDTVGVPTSSQANEDLDVSGISITPPSSNTVKTKADSTKKIYVSNIFNVQFRYPNEWYIYEKLKYGADFTFVTSPTRPKDEEPCDCGKDLYNSLAVINSYELYNTEAESKAKHYNSSIYYKGINQSIIDADNIRNASMIEYGAVKAKAANIKLGKSFIQTNGTKIVRDYVYSELHGELSAVYYVYLGDTLYVISSYRGGYSEAEDIALKEIALSFREVK